jgi:nicotinate dehydrogenase subunit A
VRARKLTVNGVEHALTPSPQLSLLQLSPPQLLRGDLELRGAEPACGEGACGACTVLRDGRLAR